LFDWHSDIPQDMGIAYYGRSYKLTDPSCGHMGCSFVAGEGGAPGACTNSPGVMSNREIRQLIKDENITPILNETAMVKYFTYAGDSWIGYDDDETYAMKQALYVSHGQPLV
jgi:chitinase